MYKQFKAVIIGCDRFSIAPEYAYKRPDLHNQEFYYQLFANIFPYMTK